MADPFVANSHLPFNFSPKGGVAMAVNASKSEHRLFSLLGIHTAVTVSQPFLTDLQGRAPMHPGQGPGRSLPDPVKPAALDGDAPGIRNPAHSIFGESHFGRR